MFSYFYDKIIGIILPLLPDARNRGYRWIFYDGNAGISEICCDDNLVKITMSNV